MNNSTPDNSEFDPPMIEEALQHATDKTGDMAGILGTALAHCVAFAPKGKEQEALAASAELAAVCMSYAMHYHYMAKVLEMEQDTLTKIEDPAVRRALLKILSSGVAKKQAKPTVEIFYMKHLPGIAAQLKDLGSGPSFPFDRRNN